MRIKVILGVFAFLVLISGFGWFLSRKEGAGKVAGLSMENKNIRGIILPHHSLASDLIDQSLLRLSKDKQYSAVVILGPNHFFPDKALLATSLDLENYSVDTAFVNELLNNFSWSVCDKEMILNEHSITTSLPYFNKYFPKAKIIPLVISPYFGLNYSEKLSQFLTENLPQNTLFLLSVDFSHQMNVLEGLSNNEKTASYFKNFDLNKLASFDDKYLDSAPAAITFLLSMRSLGVSNFEVWQNSHSAILLNNPSLLGTGYLIGVFF